MKSKKKKMKTMKMKSFMTVSMTKKSSLTVWTTNLPLTSLIRRISRMQTVITCRMRNLELAPWESATHSQILMELGKLMKFRKKIMNKMKIRKRSQSKPMYSSIWVTSRIKITSVLVQEETLPLMKNSSTYLKNIWTKPLRSWKSRDR